MNYTVKAGDTIYGISKQFGVSAMDIYNLNNLTTSNIKVGQVLKIPTNSGTNPSNMFNYTVKKGDSLYSIARIYNTTVDEIIKLNNLKNTNLSIGQVLRIPETNESVTTMPPSFTSYTVKRGDTLYSIAKNYGISVDTIIQDNALNSNTLSIGQVLKIRTGSGTGSEIVEECFGDSYVDNSTTYTVKKGDNLYSIAKKYNTSVSSIINKNNLKSTNLSIGQVLKI
ncbi:MAG: LysM peptidoglycan-binding domain-containing protein [Bacilli bacterium]|nr:LysM peptidoglycan-binding domain-containing protein [Bacilli bacterium]